MWMENRKHNRYGMVWQLRWTVKGWEATWTRQIERKIYGNDVVVEGEWEDGQLNGKAVVSWNENHYEYEAYDGKYNGKYIYITTVMVVVGKGVKSWKISWEKEIV